MVSKNVGRGISYVLIVVIIVVGAQLLLSSEFGSSPVYVVVSRSMVPTLEVGDLVITQSVPFSSINVGDVIIYVPPNGHGGCSGLTIVHRVVALASDGGLITQGDNRATNPLADEPYQWPPVHSDCVKGKVVLAVPYVGMISMLIPPPINYFLVALILVAVFVAEMRPRREEGDGVAPEGPASPAPSRPSA